MLSADVWWNYYWFAAYLGPTVTPILGAASLIYGLNKFSDANAIDAIEVIESGDHQGQLKLTVAKSPFVTREIVARVEDVSRGTHTRDNPFAGIVVTKGLDVTTGKAFDKPRGFILSNDANTDSEGLDWVLSPNLNSEVDNLFTSLVHERAKKIAAGSALQSLTDNRIGEAQKNIQINSTIDDPSQNEEVINSLREKYGQEKLESMSDREFYELYRSSV